MGQERTSFGGKTAGSRRTAARRLGRGAFAAALLAAGSVAGPAAAAEKSESIGCTSLQCVDSFEVRCTQASRLVCFTLETSDSSDFVTYSLSVVGTVPTTMLGDAEMASVPDCDEEGVCLTRPGREGTMRALVSVSAVGPIPLTYKLRTQCYSGDLLNGLSARKTVLAIKQDE